MKSTSRPLAANELLVHLETQNPTTINPSEKTPAPKAAGFHLAYSQRWQSAP